MYVFYVTHDINMKPAGRLQLLFNTHLLPKRVICRSAKMAMYSPHISVFLRRDQGYDLGSVNNFVRWGKKITWFPLIIFDLFDNQTHKQFHVQFYLNAKINQINFVRFC